MGQGRLSRFALREAKAPGAGSYDHRARTAGVVDFSFPYRDRREYHWFHALHRCAMADITGHTDSFLVFPAREQPMEQPGDPGVVRQ